MRTLARNGFIIRNQSVFIKFADQATLENQGFFLAVWENTKQKAVHIFFFCTVNSEVSEVMRSSLLLLSLNFTLRFIYLNIILEL